MKSYLKISVLLYCINFIEGVYRCDYRYSTEAKAWFKHFVIPATFDDARLRCSLEGAMLASPTKSEIEAEMKQILKNFFPANAEVFTGIHATFSKGDYHTIDGIPLAKIAHKWAQGEPDNAGNNESCLTFNNQGYLADRPCGEVHPYICVRTKTAGVNEACGTVDPEYHFESATNKCYKFHTTPRIFSRAFFTCSAEGGHLAIINSEVESKILKDLFAKYPGSTMVGSSFWKDVAFIGFHDWDEHGEWRTIHGQTLQEAGFTKFAGAEPNNLTIGGEYCGSINRNGLLCDWVCYKPSAFICEMDPNYPSLCEPTAYENAQ